VVRETVVFSNWWSCWLDAIAKSRASHKEATHGVVHEPRLRDTQGLAGQPFEPGAQRQVVAFDLLRVDFANRVDGSRQVPLIDLSGSRVEAGNPKGLAQGLRSDKAFIGSAPHAIGQHHSCEVINGLPHPALRGFTAPEAPPLRPLGALHSTPLSRDRLGRAPVDHRPVTGLESWGLFFNSSITVVGLLCRTRAISRTPLPLSVISTICRFTGGKRPE
jgi:hypothetical protein